MPFWPSPISAQDVAAAGLRPGWPVALGGRVWWTEDRPGEGGRTAIVRRDPDGTRHDLLPAPWSARTRVHEYGGRPYAVTPDGDVVFAAQADQRLYILGKNGEPKPLTPEGSRYADLLVHDGRIWCVREHHDDSGKITRSVVSIPLTGGEPRTWATGSDFYAAVALSPDGEHLAYVCWNHPRMPWDGTELRVTSLRDGRAWTVLGGRSESVLAPTWKDDATLYLVSDRSGWWNLYESGLRGDGPRALCPAEEEFTLPPWQLGGAPYALLGDGRLAVLHGRGDLRLGVLDPATGALGDLDLPWSGWQPALAADGRSVTGVAHAARAPRSVVRVETGSGRAESLMGDAERLPDLSGLPDPRAVVVPGEREVHAFLYAPGDEPAPYVIFVHGGPTAHADTALDLEKAFLTSRGIGVLDVNYGGST
ncbi:MAG: S9 family peptidase, partial [Nonomuraea sp.]|nr:S9 family peptidase [Nonomuraea sp.]